MALALLSLKLSIMNEFDNIPGVIYKKFCSFCTNEAAGEIKMPVNDEMVPVPICESCLDRLYPDMVK